jgi:hypothetical protein
MYKRIWVPFMQIKSKRQTNDTKIYILRFLAWKQKFFFQAIFLGSLVIYLYSKMEL